MLRLSRLKVAILAVGFSLPGPTASAMTIREFRKLSPPTQSAYVDAAVSMLTSAYATNGNAARGRCIQNWYFGQQGAQAPGRRQIANELDAYESLDPDKYQVESAILSVANQVCGATPMSADLQRSEKLLLPLIGLLLGAIVPVAGWFVNNRLTKLQQHSKDQLDLVNKRITEFYGPLLIACVAGEKAHKEMCSKFGVEDIFRSDGTPVCDEAGREWVLWMKHVFTPLNDLREKLVMKKLYLLLEQDVHPSFTTLFQHVALNKIILAKWDGGDMSEKVARIGFPRDLTAYADNSLKKLRTHRAKLIGQQGQRWYRRIWEKPALAPLE